MEDEKRALVLFSGGKDSLLVTLRLLDNNYQVYLVTYQNGYEIKGENVNSTIERLIKKYGEKQIVKIGIKNICSFFREFINPFYNYSNKYILENYGNITISQFNCLACRLSMYVASIIICKQMNIKYVFDGARKSQLFLIEQDEMLSKFKELFNENKIEINYLLKDFEDDWTLKNEILLRGFVPKTLEPKCLMGVPICKNQLNEEILNSIINVYESYLKPKAEKMIFDYKDIKINGELI